MKRELKTMVRGKYDLQKVRIQMGLRIVANFKAKMGQEAGKKEKDLGAKEQKIINSLRLGYKRLTDAITTEPTVKTFEGNELISDYAEYILISHYVRLEQAETAFDKQIAGFIVQFPIWQKFFKVTKGVGPLTAGVMISEFDIFKAKYPSSFHAYAGIDVGPDGKGRSRRKEHLIDREYIDKEGKTKTKKSITYNPFLKSKLMGVLAPSFIKSKSPYKDIYDNVKHRYAHHETYKDVAPAHRDMMAKRYMIKMFLIDLHMFWRELEGLEVSKPYHEAKLGISHTEFGCKGA